MPGDQAVRERIELALRGIGAWGLFGLDAVARRQDEPALWLFELCSSMGTYLVVRHEPGSHGAAVIFQGELRHLIDDDTVCVL